MRNGLLGRGSSWFHVLVHVSRPEEQTYDTLVLRPGAPTGSFRHISAPRVPRIGHATNRQLVIRILLLFRFSTQQFPETADHRGGSRRTGGAPHWRKRLSSLPLKPLHSPDLLSQPKLEQFRKLATRDLLKSLRPGNSGALKTKADGTIMDGHHRVEVLRQRGVDVDTLPREVID